MTLKTIACWPFAALFLGSGVLHFARSDVYLRLMPPYLPAHGALVALSGVIEGALGALLLLPATRRPAAWALIATLIAVFPANVYGATTAGTTQPAMPGVPVWAAWLRLPLQAVLIAWAYWYTRRDALPAAPR